MERYTPNERSNHWLTAITFVLLALSGLAMFHPALFWLSALFGGGQWMRILHPFIGLAMFASFAGLVLRFWHHNCSSATICSGLGKSAMCSTIARKNCPEVGRYNAGQKLLFFVLVACLVLLLASGLVIWRRYFSGYFPIDVVRLAVLVHAIAGFVLMAAIIVHIYAAIWVKGTMGAMLRGTVYLGLGPQHHPRWFRAVIKANSRH
ncbi:MAG: formate dehydrogenase subunit gamma [Rhodospirillales bacterium]